MRVKNSIINISVGIGNQLIITLLSFFSRTVFIQTLGLDYLGINGLFTNILAMLSLAEAGIGSSIIYSLYKPVAENDEHKINVLMKLYKKTYTIISCIILLLGLMVLPFLHLFTKDTSIQHLYVIYILFLLNTAIPYLFTYRTNLLNVYQKSYIATGIFSVSSILSTSLKIGILYRTQNYILFLIIDSTITVINSAILFYVVGRMYPFLKQKVTSKLDLTSKRSILKNVKAIVLQNIGTYLIYSTDNLIISYYVNVAAVGLYSNYFMFIEICRTFINQVFNNIYYSIGNLVAKESKETIFQVYKVTMLLNFWLYSMFAIVLYVIMEPLITIWIGPQFLMDNFVLLVLVVTFYERGMRNSISAVKTTAGIFHEDRYVPLLQAAINLVCSIVLVQYLGIAGVFIGTLISAMLIPFWTTPYFVYKQIFHKSIFHYFFSYGYYALIGVGTSIVTYYVSSFIGGESWRSFILKAAVSLVLPNLIYIIVFYKRTEFKYLWGICLGLLGKFHVKKKVVVG
ncbi:lipopolysaccharide biosynthesis protein [Paenibacillus roseipurpureus]|uniref:Oligosaccharide flippase family protein n=1 Tax=Paenibacillus roseopurpureus TaxID=2918901 RepID=A0AA96LMN1_9BACL|nr:oligosaccharide flippase family protein [Paenibacillus sp. MBLB1832]WNR43799.1 oligosaccharide flippase family protein [Paenibacillus sp. MBLB1832]